MRILGISCYFHDASAALIENGVLVEDADRSYQIYNPAESMPGRFGLQAVPVKEHVRDVVPQTNHMGTARLQTVHKETNPLYHELISRFGEATDVPVLLNSSFNVRGEPVANTPENALTTFTTAA